MPDKTFRLYAGSTSYYGERDPVLHEFLIKALTEFYNQRIGYTQGELIKAERILKRSEDND